MSTFAPAAVAPAPAPAPALELDVPEHNSSFRFSITGMTCMRQGPLTHVTDLNRTHMQELLDHQRLLDPSAARQRYESLEVQAVNAGSPQEEIYKEAFHSMAPLKVA